MLYTWVFADAASQLGMLGSGLKLGEEWDSGLRKMGHDWVAMWRSN